MRRRTVVLAGAASAMLAAVRARAQQKAKVHRVAYIATSSQLSDITGANPVNPAIRAFVHGMRDLGYVQGKNLVLDMRTLDGVQICKM